MSDQDVARLPNSTTNRIEGDRLVLEFAKREEVPIDRRTDGFVPLTGSDIESHTLEACLPDYSRVARIARLSGRAIVELGIDTNGERLAIQSGGTCGQ